VRESGVARWRSRRPWGVEMTAYRLYVLNERDLVADAIENEFASDVEALARAEAVRRDEYAVEVWAGARLVARLGGDFEVGRA
jgi:hypothetical protein